MNARIKSIWELSRKQNVPVSVPTEGQPKTKGSELRALLHPFDYRNFKTWQQDVGELRTSLVLVLDHLQDPQNFGAICRLADAFSLDGIIIPKDRTVAVGPGVYHASVGAVDTVPVVQVPNLSESIRRLKDMGFWIVGTTLGNDSTPPWEIPHFEKVALVLGGELGGLRQLIEDQCDCKVLIPMSGKVQSLNVATACAILLYEFKHRQKSSKS